MIAIVYRWRVTDGMEEQFVDGWSRVTRAIREHCGSHGSRLHRAEDGTWLAYARWPDLPPGRPASTRSRRGSG